MYIFACLFVCCCFNRNELDRKSWQVRRFDKEYSVWPLRQWVFYLINTWCLLFARQSSKCFKNGKPLNSHNSMKQIVLFFFTNKEVEAFEV